MLREELSVCFVHFSEVFSSNLLEINAAANDVVHRRASTLHNPSETGEGELGLLGDRAANEPACIRIVRTIASDEEKFALGDDSK